MIRTLTAIVTLSLLLGGFLGTILGYQLARTIKVESGLTPFEWDVAVSIGEERATNKARVECLQLLDRQRRGLKY